MNQLINNQKVFSDKNVKNKRNLAYVVILLISVILFFLLKEKALFPLIACNLIIVGIFLKNKVLKDVFCVESIFLLNYLAYVLYTPFKLLNNSYNGELVYVLSGDRELAVQIVLICGIIATISFIVGECVFNILFENKMNNIDYKVRKKSRIILFIEKMVCKYKKIMNVNVFAYFLMVAGVGLFILGILKQGGLSYLFSKYIWNSENAAEIGIMTTGVQVAFAGIFISFYTLLKKDNFRIMNILKWPGGYIFIFIALLKFIQGGRIQVMMGAITLILMYHYLYKKIKFRYIILFAVLGMIVLGYIGYFRDYKTLIPKDLKTMISYILGGSGGMEYFLNSYTNFTTMNVINSGHMSYLFGATLLDGIIFLIPRTFIPNKEQILFTNRKLNELNSIEVISPVGGLNLAAQNLLNGYIIYTVIFMVVLGGILYLLNRYKNKFEHGKLLYCMAMPYIIVSLIRNPIFYTIKELIQFAIIPYAIYLILTLGEKYEKNSI